MKNKFDVQKFMDGLIAKIFLRYIPHSVKPNHVTIIRFVLVPIVYWLLTIENFEMALIVFVIAASTDFIDGTMARTRNQITDLGKVIDPVADKLLILSILLYIGFDYLIIKVFIVFIVLELIAVIFGGFFSFALGKPIGANIYGKIKMVLQSFSVGFFILGVLIESENMVSFSEVILFGALVFALLAALENLRMKVLQVKGKLEEKRLI